MQKKVGDYVLTEKIGSGAFGQVYLGKSLKGTELCAIKVIAKDKMSPKIRSYLDREITILQKLNNPHIVKLLDIKASLHNFYLIFEHCNGGDLDNYKKKSGGQLNELATRKIMKQIVSGLCSVYVTGGIHRDIKLSNILLHYPTEEAKANNDPVAKICDFGFARLVETETPLDMSIVGTPLNMSPEMLQKLPYNVKSDIWALGTITYELLCGKAPFKAADKESLKKIIKLGDYTIPKRLQLSAEAIDFITSCIQYKDANRISWKELAGHPFICSDRSTEFDFAALKKESAKELHEDEENYKMNSRIRYNFTPLYSSESSEEDCKSEEDFTDIEQPNVEEWIVEEVNKEYLWINKSTEIDPLIKSEYVLI